MNDASRVLAVLGSALILASSGCATRDIRNVRRSAAVDPAPADQAKGYVEFHGRSGKGVVAIYLVDEPSRPVLLAATGLSADDRYSGRRHPMAVAEKLRVAVASGSHTFMIQRDGEILRVPVQENKTTPVEIDYDLVHQGASVEVYRVNAEVLPPVGNP